MGWEGKKEIYLITILADLATPHSQIARGKKLCEWRDVPSQRNKK